MRFNQTVCARVVASMGNRSLASAGFLALPLLIACGVQPESGGYEVELDLDSNDCGTLGDSIHEDVGDPDLILEFDFDEDDVDLEGADCDRKGRTVECEFPSMLYMSPTDEVDAAIYLNFDFEVDWTNEEEAEGTLIVATSCSGSMCDIVSDFFQQEYNFSIPCELSYDMELELD